MSRPLDQLQHSAEDFRNILDCLPQMVWAEEQDGREYYNQKWLDFTGVEPADIDRIGLVHPDDRAGAEAAWTEAQRTGAYETEYRLRHHTGQYRWIVSRGSPQRDEQGRITAWYGTCTDIHERKAAREALIISEALNRSMIHSNSDPILLLDRNGTILFLNDAADAAMRPLAREDVIGRSWLDVFQPAEDVTRRRAFADAAEGRRGKFVVEYPDQEVGTRWWDVSLTPILDEHGRGSGILLSSRDITDIEAAHKRLQELQSEIIHVSRQTAMGTMAATLAHELNQPLAAISNYATGLRRVVEKDGIGGPIATGIAAIQESALRAGQIVRRLRAMARQADVARAPFDLKEAVTESAHLVGLGCEGVIFEFDFHDGEPAMGDRIQIQQVLINLFRNACQAMEGCPTRRLKILITGCPGGAKVCVSDTGSGIDPACMPRLFEANFTTKEDGMGIGLPISRTIIEAHGGTLWAENGEEGARFCFTLPKAGK